MLFIEVRLDSMGRTDRSKSACTKLVEAAVGALANVEPARLHSPVELQHVYCKLASI